MPHAPVAAALSAGNRQADSKWHDGDLLFAQPNGRPIDKKTDHDDWTRLLKAAGVQHVRLHDGRHTAATLLLSENVHPRVVRQLVGHSQIRHRTCSSGHHAGTRNESGRSPKWRTA